MAWNDPHGTWYELHVEFDANPGGQMFALGEHDEFHVGPHTRLAGPGAAAMLDTMVLARAFAVALDETYRRRHGDAVVIRPREVSGTISAKLAKRIAADSAIVRARIATNNFAPNKAPLR